MQSTPEDAFKRDIDSKSSHERLKAVRKFSAFATAEHHQLLAEVKGGERVAFVRRAITQLQERISGEDNVVAAVASDWTVRPTRAVAEYSRAVELVSEALLHEILPRIGAIKLEARRSFDNYEGSRLQAKVNNLVWLMDGIEELRKAALTDQYQEFSLHEFVSSCVLAAEKPENVSIDVEENFKGLLTWTDPKLLSIAICNGLKNAVEASERNDGGRIVVSAGETEVDFWLSIIDDGMGFTGEAENAFKIGRTTKDDHRGFGLAITKQAMTTLGGSVSLAPNEPTGAIFELRWFKMAED